MATHADPSISNEELKGISDKAAKRLYNNLSETVLERRREQTNRAITEADLRQRLFTFWSERPDRCQHLFDELTKILGESLPDVRMHRIDREMKAIKEDNTKKYVSLIEVYETNLTAIEAKNAQRSQVEALEANESSRQQETKQKREKVYQRIQDLKQDTRTSFQKYAQQLLTVESVESIIRNKYDEKKEAKEFLAGYLVEKLQNEIEQIIKVNSDKFRHEIEDFLKSYEVKLPDLNVCINIPFDFLGAFLGGLAGLGSIGALSAWAAALGNLGGYILVAKLVSLLSALGIGFGFTGGTAGVIAAVAAIGGPIVLFIGLSAAFAFGVWGLLGESWQKRLAKQTVKYFEEQDICQKLLKGIDEYWQDTANSFDKGADAVETDWSNKYLPHLRDITSPTPESKEHIEEIIKKLQQLTDFFAEIPWLNINLQC